MESFFQKLHVEIFYPEFDEGVDKKISSIRYQVSYPDLKGNPTVRAQCAMNFGNGHLSELQMAVWNTSAHYQYMLFNFLRTDSPNNKVIITRSVYYKPEINDKTVSSQITIDTHSGNVNTFRVIEQTPKMPVHNTIAIAIGELGANPNSSLHFYKAEF